MDAGRFALSWGLAVFTDPATEAAFAADQRPRLAAQMRLLAFLPGLYAAALVLDYQVFGTGGPFWTLAALRLTVWGLVGAAGALAARGPRAAQALLFGGVSLLFVTEVVEHYLLVQVHGPATAQELPFLALFVLGVYMMLPLTLGLSLGSALGGSVLFLGYLAATRAQAAGLGLPALYLLFANGLGFAFRVTWNRSQRRDFALRTRLGQEVAERRAAEADARRANEAKGRFLAVMSHEIRTPLNGVLGGVQLLQALPLQPDQRGPLELLARNGDLLARLLDDLLDQARLETGHLRVEQAPFSPAQLVAAVRADLEPLARAKGLAFRVEQAGPMPALLLGDALRLRQVLVNLLGNAVKFTDEGEVVLGLETSWGDGPGLRCAFRVRDTGPGLDAGAQERVFAPFEQGDASIQRRHGGAGLGLAISRQLVAAMGGTLALESEPGQGCRFTFTLPLPIAEAAPGNEGAQSLTVLVVDDLEANRIVAAGLLEVLGHRAVCAPSGAAALAILDRQSVDAVLLDVHMRDLDGREVLERLRARPDPRVAGLPVLLSSADTEGCLALAERDPGVRGVLPKPIRRDRLAALLRTLPSPTPPSWDSQVDEAHVARILGDLGPAVWAEGLRACRDSAQASLDDLAHPGRAPQALHRLAGLAATYAMTGLHRLVRTAEAQLAAGAPCPVEPVRACCLASLEKLWKADLPAEATPSSSPSAPASPQRPSV